MANRTTKGRFVKGKSGKPRGRPKNPWPDYAPDPPAAAYCAPDPAAADRRFIPNIVVEARKYSALAIDTLVELTKDNHADSSASPPRRRFSTAVMAARRNLWTCIFPPMRSRNGSRMTDAELAALEARMIAAAPIVLEAAAEVSDDAGDVEDSPPDALA